MIREVPKSMRAGSETWGEEPGRGAQRGTDRQTTIRVLLVDDHEIPRKGIARDLSLEPGIEVVGQASDGVRAVELARELWPHVVIMDLHMPVMDGFEAMARIRAEDPEARVLVLTMSDERHDVVGALRENAAGYVVKDDPSEEFVRAIRLVARGGSYVSPGPNARRHRREPWDDFSERDLTMLQMVADGKGDKEIGEAVHLAERTVKHRLKEIRDALGAENRTQAAVLAVRRGILRGGWHRSSFHIE